MFFVHVCVYVCWLSLLLFFRHRPTNQGIGFQLLASYHVNESPDHTCRYIHRVFVRLQMACTDLVSGRLSKSHEPRSRRRRHTLFVVPFIGVLLLPFEINLCDTDCFKFHTFHFSSFFFSLHFSTTQCRLFSNKIWLNRCECAPINTKPRSNLFDCF